MKKFPLGTVGLIALGGLIATSSVPAMAADLAARPYPKALPMIPVMYNWSGFYVGANGGWGTSRNCWDFAGTTAQPLAANLGEGCHDASGGTVGGQFGYVWQIGAWVFGLEAQGNWADFKGTNVSLLPTPGTINDSNVDAFGLFTARVGYAWENTLIYAKGGAALTGDKYTVYGTRTGAVTDTAKEIRWGASVGAGLEYGFAPAWSIGFEYDHLFMGNRDIAFATTSVDRINQDLNVVSARINYRWGGPVVARY
ncbi:outer membrane protein [Rhodopseudomonas parapalustris]